MEELSIIKSYRNVQFVRCLTPVAFLVGDQAAPKLASKDGCTVEIPAAIKSFAYIRGVSE